MLSINNIEKLTGYSIQSINGLLYVVAEINTLKDCYIIHLEAHNGKGSRVIERVILNRIKNKTIDKYTFKAIGNGNIWEVNYANLHTKTDFLHELQLFLYNIKSL